MRVDYTEKELKMINTLLDNMTKINSLESRTIKDMDKTTIVEIGSNAEEKLFLLNVLLDDIIKEEGLQTANTSTLNLNENASSLVETLNRILLEKELVYTVNIPSIPGVKIPCSNLFEAKRVAKELKFDANVLYNDQVVI